MFHSSVKSFTLFLGQTNTTRSPESGFHRSREEHVEDLEDQRDLGITIFTKYTRNFFKRVNYDHNNLISFVVHKMS